jgi:hydrogenase expression/formation protein HypE
MTTEDKHRDKTASFIASCPLPITSFDTVQLGHGSGGRMMQTLISDLFLWAFQNPILNKMDDQGVVEINGAKLAISTDSFVVDPLFFPGGNIGELAVFGTVNDVAMSGARPLYLTVGFIIEEGFSIESLRDIVISMKQAAERCGVCIITGDTKVVHKGKGDKLFINTTGVGVIEHNFVISGTNVRSGDKLIINGGIAEHGIAVLSKREGLSFETTIESDAAPLCELTSVIVGAGADGVHAMRDPTRGGVAATLNEFAGSSQVGIRIFENQIPVKAPVAGACAILGLDPLYVANEGKLIVAVSAEKADLVLAAMRSHPLGADSRVFGEVIAEDPGMVTVRTALGSWRIVDMPLGEQLPRIC